MSSGYVGSLTIAESIPLALTATAQIDGVRAPTLAQLNARLAGVVRALAQIEITPPSASANADAAAAAQAAIAASIQLGFPSVDAQAAALLELRAELELAIQLLLAISLGIDIQTPGVHLYRVTERNADQAIVLRNMLNPGLPGAQPGDQVEGWYLAATAPDAKAALSVVLG